MKPSTRFSTFASFGIWLIPVLVQAQVHLPFSRQARDLSNVLVGRGSNPSLSLSGSDYIYVVNATVGTPGQKVELVISPSVSDTWVPDATSTYCNYTEGHEYYDPNYGYRYNYTYSSYCLWGRFDKSASSTYQRANAAYRSWTTYTPDSTYVEGANFTDTLTVGDVSLENLPMGLASGSDQWIGALGLGSNSSMYGEEYDNFPDRLVKAGTIATKAYSIWLNTEDGSSGSLLMGAVDTSRYDGTLTRMDAYADTGAMYASFGVAVNGINGSSSSSAAAEAFTTNELPFGASIGHGETFSNLPDPIAQKMWSMAGASYNRSISLATIPCDAATKAKDGGARFTFELGGAGGPVLDVRLADLILPQNVAALRWRSNTPDAPAPPNTCLFAVQNGSTWYSSYSYSSSSSEYYNVGAAMLRRSYVVFDIVNQEVAIAPVKFGGTAAPSVVAFKSYGAAAPSSTAFCTGSEYSCASSGGGTSGSGSGSGSGRGSGSGDNSTGSDPGSVNVGLVAGLSVAFGLLTLVGLLGAFAVWRKMASGKPAKEEVESDAEQGDGHSVATDRTPVVAGGRGQPGGPLPPVQEEMTETSRDQAPQLAPLPVTEGEHAGGSGHWPLQESSVNSEAPSRDIPHESTGETQPAVDKGKGKEVATHEDH